ncbi:bifunctional hydroxymethylpyrimidine kinase/phosphomethylpyrimidine kinase [Lentibacillus saliphilus]|uniref:bifunctional hydroxymethylpyrimidine kinase/phosphomethylpyrimidine kinase n=1 Tax=Lentibacillus saliphilus TaxID=2737028 RepID=UPI001C30047D|nr:bifunctional hydroxymethylpyrimidine kinase/phosphomethylpyrimidine kinase [Lentibacillus saliphilus]
MKPARVLTIAGAASGGSAGIQADLKTFQELDVYGMSVITAIVGRHPKTHKNVHPQTWEAIEAQFATAMNQVGVDSMKTGMLFSKDVIEKTAVMLKQSGIQDIVVDPVMVGKLDSKLLADDAIDALIDTLLPLAKVITPNMPEASLLLGGRKLETVDDLKTAAVDLHRLGPDYVLVKGGRLSGPAVDVLYDGEQMTTFEAPRIDTMNTSGAGCSYSAAITAYIAKGKSVVSAVGLAKEYITAAIDHSFTYTDKVGPTYHAARRRFGTKHDIKVATVTR